MSPFVSGKDLEDRLKSRLERIGCLIESKEKYDHEFKLDFMLYRLAGFEKPMPISVGVQVTTAAEDLDKQREFLEVQRRLRPVQKSIYLILDSQLDVEGGGEYAAFVALGCCIFDRANREKRVIGVRINRDFSFEMFDLDGNLRSAQAPRADPERQEVWVEGRVNYYKRLEKFGFIGWDGAPDFWFGRDNVQDSELLGMLDDPEFSVSGTPIVFQSAGITRGGEKRPTAIRICLKKP
ncbi:MAG: hypothetical protein HYZ81_21425 [Nitrospinae bacterium]|nr:hypothetical protein [Nitrospinota bacterium]